ncbi:DNA damage-inducible protein [Gracilaria domingensis]|nr:DNA damage-inducible protein [Gracilaria domingensis]
MEITLVSEVNGNVTTISVEPTDTVNRLVQHVQSALSIPAASQRLTHYGNTLEPSALVSSTRLVDGDLVMVQMKPTSDSQPASSRAAAALDMIRGDQNLMSSLRTMHPELHQRILNGDETAVQELASMSAMARRDGPMLPPGMDPMSAEAQKVIEERIRQENIQSNMHAAMEHNPESFGSVVMLFVKCKINSEPNVTAFVDSGAQSTIISKSCAERCNILRLMDTRFAGTAQGVGTAKIHGRIHMALLTLADEIFEVSFIVMDEISSGYDMLLGLDMLRKHQACIDLENDCLRIGSAQVPFLAEKDIPRSMRGPAGQVHRPGSSEAQPGTNPSSIDRPSSSVGGNATRNPVPAADESKVSQLVGMGFSRHDALQALASCNGNIEQAAAVLAQSRYGF